MKLLKQSSIPTDVKIYILVEWWTKKLKVPLSAPRVAAVPVLSCPHQDKGLAVSGYCWYPTSHGQQGWGLPLLVLLFGKGLSFLRNEKTCLFPLAKQRFFAIFENASAAGNPGLAWLDGPHLTRPLSLVFSWVTRRFDAGRTRGNIVKKSGVFSYLFCRKLKKVVPYSSKTHSTSGGRCKGPQIERCNERRKKKGEKENFKGQEY